jgi:hypothetical protein
LIDFRYHLVSIVAVFLALAIGIVLGSTALQGKALDTLKGTIGLLQSQLNNANNASKTYSNAMNADNTFVQTAEPTLLKDRLTGENLVVINEPGAASDVISGVEAAAKEAGATITGTLTLQPKFNDLTGATTTNLGQVNSLEATTYSLGLSAANDSQTVYQQDAASLIAAAVLQQAPGEVAGLTPANAKGLLDAYVAGGYLNYDGTPEGTSTTQLGAVNGRATLAVIVTPPASAADGTGDPTDEVLPALASGLASQSVATLVAGPVLTAPYSQSAITVLRGSSVNSQVSSVDNADTPAGQVTVIWALADQVQGAKPKSYGVSAGASAVSPVPSPVPSVTPTATTSGTPTPTSTSTSTKGTGEGKHTVIAK